MSEVIKKAELERAYREVERVLAFGQKKYPDNKWKTQSLELVMEHAIEHERLSFEEEVFDSESGCHNMAHSVARRLMALSKMLEEGEAKGDG